ncbi:NlpC/P60 family protein [Pelagibacterium lacus]|uniref:NlpC/P60 domain-containing protein n=1 Tax=Pelagibacterium lacus TaxID=2282655 RepID=A0A369W6Z4_9HYPH|nr:NlpC/P60 family protein [Pelagibacterium lacus]RDE10464.1 hypothetical protein DVH29_00480 [Pelagibacterium lacus]
MNPERIVREARRWIGTPYRHQAAALGAGADCLGLLRGVWRELYGREVAVIPPYAADWRHGTGGAALEAAARRHLVAAGPEPQAGDVILLRLMRHHPPRHCAIMVTKDRFIHAQEHLGVVEMALGESWAQRIAGVYRFP